MKCGACGWDNRDIARYCRACGIDLKPGEVLKPSQSPAEAIQAAPQATSQPTGQSMSKVEAGDVDEQDGDTASQDKPASISDGRSMEECQDSVCTTASDKVTEIPDDAPTTSPNRTESKVTDDSKITAEKPQPSGTSSRAEPIATHQETRNQQPLLTAAEPLPVSSTGYRQSNTVRYSVISVAALTVAGLGYVSLSRDHSDPLSPTNVISPSPTSTQVQMNSLATQPRQSATPTQVTTSNAVAQTIPDATSLSSAETPTVIPVQEGAQRSANKIYASYCMKCHAKGISGSPAIDNPEAWTGRLSRPRAALYVLPLKRNTPPCLVPSEVTDVEARAAVDLMIQRATAATSRTTTAISPPESVKEFKPPIADVSDWVAALRSELEICQKKGFVEKLLCAEKARWKYCAPNRWGTVKECEVSKSDKSNYTLN